MGCYCDINFIIRILFLVRFFFFFKVIPKVCILEDNFHMIELPVIYSGWQSLCILICAKYGCKVSFFLGIKEKYIQSFVMIKNFEDTTFCRFFFFSINIFLDSANDACPNEPSNAKNLAVWCAKEKLGSVLLGQKVAQGSSIETLMWPLHLSCEYRDVNLSDFICFQVFQSRVTWKYKIVTLAHLNLIKLYTQ